MFYKSYIQIWSKMIYFLQNFLSFIYVVIYRYHNLLAFVHLPAGFVRKNTGPEKYLSSRVL